MWDSLEDCEGCVGVVYEVYAKVVRVHKGL